jgi:alpha-ketoglutarate-dependent taurine dioxygenase
MAANTSNTFSPNANTASHHTNAKGRVTSFDCASGFALLQVAYHATRASTELFAIAEDPAIVYEHQWRIGDLVIWDNWCSIHARKDFPREEPRLMRRLTIEGEAMRF